MLLVSLSPCLLVSLASLRVLAVASSSQHSTGMPPHRVVRRVARAFEPAGHGRLLLRVELDRLAALDVEVAEEGLVPPGEREPRHRRVDADVDAEHAGVEVLPDLPG